MIPTFGYIKLRNSTQKSAAFNQRRATGHLLHGNTDCDRSETVQDTQVNPWVPFNHYLFPKTFDK